MDEKEKKSFVKETIKEKPLNRRKLFRRTMITICLAIIFGLTACLTFIMIEPVVSNLLYSEDITRVSFPEEKEEVKPDELLTEKSVLQQELVEEVVEEAKSGIKDELTLIQYERIYTQFREIAKKTETSMATVIGISEQQDWFRDTTENENTTSGLIVAENGVELLILADANNLQNATEYHVRFSDGRMVAVQMKQKDSQTGLAIFSARLSDMKEETRKVVNIAKIGSSLSDGIVGRPVIAVGAPNGVAGSVVYGMITTNEKKVSVTDAMYHTFMTDMSVFQNMSGVIINVKGEVLGILAQSVTSSIGTSAMSAYGISDIKNLIAKMSNGDGRAYIGIKGMDVTEEAHSETGVPYGIYVTEVITESPAMRSGIQNGDVVTMINTYPIHSFQDYKSALYAQQPQNVLEITLMRFDGVEYNEIKLELTTGEAE